MTSTDIQMKPEELAAYTGTAVRGRFPMMTFRDPDGNYLMFGDRSSFTGIYDLLASVKGYARISLSKNPGTHPLFLDRIREKPNPFFHKTDEEIRLLLDISGKIRPVPESCQ